MKKVLVGEILSPEPDGQKQEARESKVRSQFWGAVRKAASRIPFIEDVAAAYYCALDPATPARVRAILLAALAYFILPTDLVPDFIAGIGFADDISVLGAALAALRVHLKPGHYEAARAALTADKMSPNSAR